MVKSPTKQKLLVILGPTASGKSDLAVEMARWIEAEKIGGYAGAEIISADSRQVYTGLDVGTGKITQKEMKGVPHHLLDIADPNDARFTALDWKHAAEKTIADIAKRSKLPIICGGTGFYISTLIDDLGFPEVPADPAEQAQLESLSAEELFAQLKKLDPKRAATIDLKNKRRLALAIIIAKALGSVPELKTAKDDGPYDVLQIGTELPDSELKERIRARLVRRIEVPNENGFTMIKEAELLHATPPAGLGLSFERMDELGLEYRYLAQFLQMKISKEDMIETLSFKIWQYAKRQKTWWKKDARIKWHHPADIETIKKDIGMFLK
jgi:tRNA dimethylallyltransferase